MEFYWREGGSIVKEISDRDVGKYYKQLTLASVEILDVYI